MNPCIVGGLLVRREETLTILLGKRSEARLVYPNIRDVPGGHSESGELVEDTLMRELREEIDVVPRQWHLLAQIDLPAHGQEPAMPFFLYEVTAWTGVPCNIQPEEHAEIGWFTIDEACQLTLAHSAYEQLIRGLRRDQG
jgi:8-oxo-dGTP diphosphatase